MCFFHAIFPNKMKANFIYALMRNDDSWNLYGRDSNKYLPFHQTFSTMFVSFYVICEWRDKPPYEKGRERCRREKGSPTNTTLKLLRNPRVSSRIDHFLFFICRFYKNKQVVKFQNIGNKSKTGEIYVRIKFIIMNFRNPKEL